MQTVQLVELVFKKQFSALLWKFVSRDKEVFSVIEVELISLQREGVFVYRRQVNFQRFCYYDVFRRENIFSYSFIIRTHSLVRV